MTARFRSAFSGSSGFVAARAAVRVVDVARRETRHAFPDRAASCKPAPGQGKSSEIRAV